MKSLLIFMFLSLVSSSTMAFDPVAHRDSQLKSLFNVSKASVSSDIDYSFFEPIKPGESLKAVQERMVVAKSPIDRALQYDGRITKNLESLLSTKMAEQFSIKTVDWRVAPYRIKIKCRINQSLDLQGSNMFDVRVALEIQEFAISNSGWKNFATVSTFFGQSFAKTKEGVEGMLYEALEKALDEWKKELEVARKHCNTSSCQVPPSAIRTLSQ